MNRVGLPLRVRVFFEGVIEDEGEGVVVEGFGLEEEFGLGEEGGREKRRNEDVPSPNTKDDRRKKSNGERIRTKRRCGRVETTKLSRTRFRFFLELSKLGSSLIECKFSLVNWLF